MSSYVPLDVPIPPLPDTQLFSELQWKTLLSLADTMIPSVRSSGNANTTKVVPAPQFDSAVSKLASDIPGPDSAQKATRYLEENASSNPAFRDNIQRLFGTFVHQEGRKGLSLVLNALKYVVYPRITCDTADRGLNLTAQGPARSSLPAQLPPFRTNPSRRASVSLPAGIRRAYHLFVPFTVLSRPSSRGHG